MRFYRCEIQRLHFMWCDEEAEGEEIVERGEKEVDRERRGEKEREGEEERD